MEVPTSLSSSSSSNFERRGIAAAVGGEEGGVLSSSSSMKDVSIVSSNHTQAISIDSVTRPLPCQASLEGEGGREEGFGGGELPHLFAGAIFADVVEDVNLVEGVKRV